MGLTLVIPIFDESGSLPILLKDLESQSNPGIEFLLVDNGSFDQSVIDLLSEGGPNWESFRIEKNIGFGGAIKEGILRSNSEFIGWIPGNLKINTQELFEAIRDLALDESTVIKFRRNRPDLPNKLKTLFFGLIQTLFSGVDLMDSGGTPTIASRKLTHSLAAMDSPNDYTFESFAFLYFRVQKIRIMRPAINYGLRVHGSSHWQNGLGSEVSLLLQTLIGTIRWKKTIKKATSNDTHNSPG